MTSGSAKSKSILLRGIPVSPGIYVGRVVIHDAAIPSAAPMKVPASQVEQQIRFLESALARTREEISQLQAKIREALDEAHAAIFDPHLLFVDDPLFKDGVVARIRGQRESAPYAVMGVIQELAAQFAQMKDQYISSRATDVIDVGNRICKHLAKSYTISPAKEKETSHTSDMIIFAHDLSPSDTAQMDHRIVKAFAMEIGGPTSHTAILAKGLEIPAVVGLGPVLEHVGPETTAIVDGYEGTVIVHPTAEEIRRARDRRRRHLAQERTLNKLATLPAETLDGYRVELSANLELPDEIPHAVAHGADGVGLFRTEFLYFNEAGLPEEDRQFDLYKNVLKKFSPRSVIFRTLDIGGDKVLPYLVERNCGRCSGSQYQSVKVC
ncbi:phosphoenolpyruvate--protein phosphotransferase [Candidatus Sumerlaeota bacterium]|nr:phosphoenolpyruvate--protein phosphotransferase [Candidatus Sumerlaeota bacterium]